MYTHVNTCGSDKLKKSAANPNITADCKDEAAFNIIVYTSKIKIDIF